MRSDAGPIIKCCRNWSPSRSSAANTAPRGLVKTNLRDYSQPIDLQHHSGSTDSKEFRKENGTGVSLLDQGGVEKHQ
jgi:hypothetical protein